MQRQRFSLMGIYGGTFDPIHYGHLRIAEELADQLDLSKMLFVPSGEPRLRAVPATSRVHRTAMVDLAVQGNDRFVLDKREVNRPGISTTVATLQEYRNEFGYDTALCCIVGMDAFIKIDQWIEWRKLFTLCHLIVVPRLGYTGHTEHNWTESIKLELNDRYTANADELAYRSEGLVYFAATSLLDISASRIRSLLASGRSVRYLLPDAVRAYITTNHLYMKDGI